jgi:hypothetical protein
LEIRVSQTIYLGWPQTMIFSISVSQVARITDMNHWCLAESWGFKRCVSSNCWQVAAIFSAHGISVWHEEVLNKHLFTKSKNSLANLGPLCKTGLSSLRMASQVCPSQELDGLLNVYAGWLYGEP